MAFFIRKNKFLEQIIKGIELEASNNYKDAANQAFRALDESYKNLVRDGKLSGKQTAYYGEVVEKYRRQMEHFHH